MFVIETDMGFVAGCFNGHVRLTEVEACKIQFHEEQTAKLWIKLHEHQLENPRISKQRSEAAGSWAGTSSGFRVR
jgi:hypothetical protein